MCAKQGYGGCGLYVLRGHKEKLKAKEILLLNPLAFSASSGEGEAGRGGGGGHLLLLQGSHSTLHSGGLMHGPALPSIIPSYCELLRIAYSSHYCLLREAVGEVWKLQHLQEEQIGKFWE